jgi:hypothetical protein
MTHMRQKVDDPPIEGVEYVTREEGIAILDRQARKYFNMSGEEFARRYRAGALEDMHDPKVDVVAILIPLADP